MSAALVVFVGSLIVATVGRAALMATWRGEVVDRADLVALRRAPDPLVAWPAGRARHQMAAARDRWKGRSASRRRGLVAGLPAALEEVARALRAGASLRQAVGEAGRAQRGPAGEALAAVATRAEMGMPLASSLEQLVAEDPLPEVRLVAAALGLAAEAGGRAADAVEAVATTLREGRAASMEVAAQSAQARLSALVISLLPVAFTVWCLATDDRAATFLLATGPGWVCLLGGLTLLGAGAWWMSRIVGSAR
jgi:tight adherence protein B